MEIVNGQGTHLSFRKIILLRGVEPRPDPWAIAQDEINPANLCAPRPVNTGSPMVLCLDGYRLRRGGSGSTAYVAQGLEDLGNVVTLILSNSAVEPCLAALELENQEGLQRFSAVHSLVIYSLSRVDWTLSDILQCLLRVSRKRKTAGSPFRSVTLAISSAISKIPPGELAALNEYAERFEFLAGDDTSDWDVDKYFIPSYDPWQRRRDEYLLEAI